MKNFLIATLFLVSANAFAQTTYTFATYNPLEITAPDNTNTHILQCSTAGETEVLIKFPSGNAGTVKVNASTSTITSSPSLSATTDVNGIVVRATARTGYKIYLRFSNTGDKVVITKW